MSEIPIIDAAVCGYLTIDKPIREVANTLIRVVAALRVVLPWDPEPETIKAMALAYSTDWDSATVEMREWWRLKSVDAYRAQPIMRELYPEGFR